MIHEHPYRAPANAPLHNPGPVRVVGNGVEWTRKHDAGLDKELKVWRANIRFCGGEIIEEYNANDLAGMLGDMLNKKATYKERVAVADKLGFGMHEGKIQAPDHRMVIVWKDERVEVKDFEHINPKTYNSHQTRAKLHGHAHITGIGGVGKNDPRGRRVKDGPDLFAGLIGKRARRIK